MNRQRITDQLVFAAYSISGALGSNAFRRWFSHSEAMAHDVGATPGIIEGEFKCRPKGLRDNHIYPLALHRARFQKEIEADNVTYLNMKEMSFAGGYVASDWRFYATLGLCERTSASCHAVHSLGLALGSRDVGDSVALVDFCDQCFVETLGLMAPQYGLAVIMPRKFLPGGYVIGVGGEGPDELAMDATAWMDLACECPRRLRNVFGYNILGAPHLDMDVGEMRLADWIRASKDRGRIEDLGGGLFLWTFQDGAGGDEFLQWNYPPVVAVREELKRHKVFLWQRE